MKTALLLLSFHFLFSIVSGQQIAIAADMTNVFYLGVDNPISVTAENCPCKNLVVKTDNGKITGTGCKLTYWGKTAGTTTIIVYKRTEGKLKKIGSNVFRVKRIPPPTFKIGPYGYSRPAKKLVIVNQQFVRAVFENFDYQAVFKIDSFHVKIFFGDSCKLKSYFNTSGKISQNVHEAFGFLKKDDIVVFDKIFAKGPDGLEWELDPLILTIEN